MKILAIESSGNAASVAVTTEGKLLGEYTINNKKTHSQTLLPMIDALLRSLELSVDDIDAIAVSKGPGSFTGLRIGSATAKGLGLAAGKDIIPVPTVDALAMNCYGSDRVIVPLMDARRRQVYTGIYHFEDDELIADQKTELILIEEAVEQVNELGKPAVFLGDGASLHRDYIKEHASVPVSFAPATRNEQSAASVALLAERLFAKGIRESAGDHKPDYLRPSQAERELGGKAKDFRI